MNIMFDFLKRKFSKFSKKLEPEVKPKVALATKIKKTVIGKAVLSENELNSFLHEFEIALIEADVAAPVAEKICNELKEKFQQTEFKRSDNVKTKLESIFKETISGILDKNKGFDLVERVKNGEKPFKILFLGPNGVGKTATIAKIAQLLHENGMKSVFAASDTFRAASIEQLEEHGKALNVRVIKHKYGADPAAVAFDAVQHAKSQNLDAALIDTAGRQETNINLIEQMGKINRVIKPDLKIFIGEALVGNAILEQMQVYKDGIGLDGIILTKLDLDVKGGAVFSAIYSEVPVLYFCTGQEYKDLIPFSKNFLLEKLFS